MKKKKHEKKADRIRAMGGYTKDDLHSMLHEIVSAHVIEKSMHREPIDVRCMSACVVIKNGWPVFNEEIKGELIEQFSEGLLHLSPSPIVMRTQYDPESDAFRIRAMLKILLPKEAQEHE